MTARATPNTRYYIQVLSTYTDDSTPSLLVVFDNARYLFNAPESFSRICVQSRIGMRRMGKVFVGKIGDDTAGLPGLILSCGEGGNKSLEIIGPQGMDHFIATCRMFTRRYVIRIIIV